MAETETEDKCSMTHEASPVKALMSAVLAHGRPNNIFRDAETGFSFLSD